MYNTKIIFVTTVLCCIAACHMFLFQFRDTFTATTPNNLRSTVGVKTKCTTTTDTMTNANTNEKAKKLEYIHIAKTGGSAIEREASMKGITWGACHYITMKHIGPGCQHPDLVNRGKGYNRTNVPFQFDGGFGEPWHTPPHWMKHNIYEDRNNNDNDNSINTFTVVRDPYSRMISHYYCKYKGINGHSSNMDMDQINNIELMNSWIQDLLQSPKKRLGHFLPQHYYVYDKYGIKLINHVLKHENLSEEFSELMEKYDIDISLPDVKFNARKSTSSLKVEDLNSDTIALINEVYYDDFRRFEYRIIL
jgi:hypothetical protein